MMLLAGLTGIRTVEPSNPQTKSLPRQPASLVQPQNATPDHCSAAKAHECATLHVRGLSVGLVPGSLSIT